MWQGQLCVQEGVDKLTLVDAWRCRLPRGEANARPILPEDRRALEVCMLLFHPATLNPDPEP